MNSQSVPFAASSVADSFATLQFGSDASMAGGAIDLRAMSQSISDAPERFARDFMDSVSVTLDEVEAALAKGADERLAELGSRLKTFSRMASALGLAALCDVLAGTQLRAAVDQTCDIS